jgi:hypothetical protein
VFDLLLAMHDIEGDGSKFREMCTGNNTSCTVINTKEEQLKSFPVPPNSSQVCSGTFIDSEGEHFLEYIGLFVLEAWGQTSRGTKLPNSHLFQLACLFELTNHDLCQANSPNSFLLTLESLILLAETSSKDNFPKQAEAIYLHCLQIISGLSEEIQLQLKRKYVNLLSVDQQAFETAHRKFLSA